MPRLVVDYQVPLNTVGYNPLAGWEFETIPAVYVNGAIIKILATSEIAHALSMRVKSGSQTIQDFGSLSLDAVPGHLPVDELVAPLVFRAMPGDLVGISINELLGAATYLQMIVDIEPV
jgi:hypothetical protein